MGRIGILLPPLSHYAMDLAQYTLPQLKQLSARITKELERRQTANKAALLKKLKRLAEAHGVTLEEVVSGAEAVPAKRVQSAPAPARRAAVPVKYRHPSNRALAWSGRGRRPQWVEAWITNGGSLDALEIAAQKLAAKTFAADYASRTAEPTNDETTGESLGSDAGEDPGQ